MSGFKELEEYVEPWLDLPIRGKVYRIPSADAETGIFCQRALELGAAALRGDDISESDLAGLRLDDEQERDFNRRLLGDAYDEMVSDGVPWEFIKHAAQTVFAWTVQDRSAAEKVWKSGGRPEARRPAPQDRKAPAKKAAKKK